METKAQKNCLTCPAFKRSIFHDLSENEIEELTKNKTPIQIKKGQILFHQGNKTLGVHCIKDGRVKLTTVTDDGRENIKGLLKEGDLVGYNNLIEKNDYYFSAVAVVDSHICQVDKEYFQSLINSRPEISNILLKKLCQEIHSMELREATILYKNVKVRIAQLLLHLIHEFGSKESEGIKLNLHLSRSEMASMIGIAGETLIRFLTELKERNIIKQQGKNILVVKLDELNQIARG